MRITVLSSALALVTLFSAHTSAALLTQTFSFDEPGLFEVDGLNAGARVQHFFAPFDAALGTLTDVSIVATATSQAGLEQFQCALSTCTAEFLLDLVLTLEPGEIELDEAGNFTTNRFGVHFGGLADISYPSISAFGPLGWDIEDFYTTPLQYLAFYNWRCLDCSEIGDPLLVNLRGGATLTYEYTPSPVPAPSTLLLFTFGLAALTGRYLRATRSND